MTVDLTPRGTRGWEPPRLLRPLMRAVFRLGVLLYHWFGDRMRVQGRPVLLLSTRGAKSGKARKTILCWFPDGDNSWLVVASNAGSARHPAWYVNLAKNPDQVSIEIGGRQVKVEPQSLRDAERAEAWRRVIALAPGYAAYQEQTDLVVPALLCTASGHACAMAAL